MYFVVHSMERPENYAKTEVRIKVQLEKPKNFVGYTLV